LQEFEDKPLPASQVKQALLVYSPECANPSYLDEVLGYVARRLCQMDLWNVRAVPLSEQSTVACLLFTYEPLDLIIVVGGDLATRCVLESLAQTQLKLPVGLVPLGTDTLLAGKLGIKPCHEREDVEHAIQIIAARNISPMDLGKINGRYFAIDAVIGNIPPVVLAPESTMNRNFGVIGHLMPFVKSVGQRSMSARVLIESEGFYRLASSIFITNARGVGPTTGSGIEELSDGLLRLCMVNPLSLSDYGRLAYRFGAWYVSGVVSGDAPLLVKEVRQVRIETDRQAPVMVDGEIWGTTPCDIEVVPGAVNVIIPARQDQNREQTHARDMEALPNRSD
jgi:diacylglycerol kinase (ATP)